MLTDKQKKTVLEYRTKNPSYTTAQIAKNLGLTKSFVGDCIAKDSKGA